MLEDFSPALISVSHLTEESVPPVRQSYGQRISVQWELELITGGRGEIVTDGQSMKTLPGRLFIRRPQMKLEGYTPYYSYFIVFRDDGNSLEEMNFPPFLDHMEYLLEAFKLLRKNFTQPDAVSVLETRGILSFIIASVLRRQRREMPLRIQQSERYIKEHLTEGIGVAELARMAGYSLSHYTRLFKESLGQTPVEYMLVQRVQNACERLEETDDTMEKIALDCGFSNLSYFFRAFKAVKHQTPGEYRRAVRIYSIQNR